MIAPRVLTEADVYGALKERGFRPTARMTATGRFWAHENGQHLQVPHSLNGFYPDWMLHEVIARVGEIAPSGPKPTQGIWSTIVRH